jgi:hypothetical protein
MRNINGSFYLLALLLFFVGGAARSAGEINNGYVVTNQTQLGITRAFDDGQNTVIVFADVDSQKPALIDRDGKKIHFQKVGNYAVLPGLYNEVHIAEGDVYGVLRADSQAIPANGSTNPLPAQDVSRAIEQHAVKTYPQGSASYELPFVKQPAPATSATPSPRASPVQVASALPVAEIHAAQPPVQIAPPLPPQPAWTGQAPTDAKTMLQTWADKAHWHLDWDFDHTFPITSNVAYDGDFKAAVIKHYSIYTDRRRTKTPICLDMHTVNHEVHVYARDDTNQCTPPESKQVNQ